MLVAKEFNISSCHVLEMLQAVLPLGRTNMDRIVPPRHYVPDDGVISVHFCILHESENRGSGGPSPEVSLVARHLPRPWRMGGTAGANPWIAHTL